MKNFMDFTSDKVDVFHLVIDRSGSMDGDRDNVVRGLNDYKTSFENFPEKGSIAVAISRFNSSIEFGPFTSIDDMDLHYSTGGGTALYYAITMGAEHLHEYINEIIQTKSIVPKATFIVFSDGHPEGEDYPRDKAVEAINQLNMAGITTVFVAFGGAIESKFGDSMGFESTRDVHNRGDLEHFLGVELSKSCKEQSRSLKGLGANFFSKAVKENSSSGYSGATQQVLEDDSWIDDI